MKTIILKAFLTILTLTCFLCPSISYSSELGKYALDFGPVNDLDYVIIGKDSVFDTDELTFEAWIKPTGLPTGIGIYEGRSTIVWNGDGAVGNDPYIFYINEYGAIEAQADFARNGTYGIRAFILGSTVLSLNIWHHVALVLSPTKMQLFLDGNKDGEVIHNLGPLTKGYSDLVFGRHMWQDNPFGGIMDEMRLWGIARTEEEIRNNRWAGHIKGDEPGLVGYWDFNEGSGSILHDKTKNENHGAIYGAIWTNDSAPDNSPTILSMSSVEASLGSQLKTQININDATGVTSGDITIKYDPSILSVGDIKSTPLTTDMNLTPNISVSGQIKIAMAGTKAILSGSGSLIDISFTVNSKATVGTETMIKLVDTDLYDESGKVIPMNFENGTIKIIQACIKGDVNNDGNIKSNDATLILRIAAGLLESNDYQKCAADVNGDGKIRSNDATIVLRKAAGLEAPVKDFIADRHISISLSETHGLKGETISVPIRVDNSDILSSGDMSISYDSKVLRAIGVLFSDGLLNASNISQPGLIRISFAGVDRLNDGKLAEIRFEILTDNVSPLTFKMAELYGTDALPLNSKFTNKQFRSWAVAPELSALLQNYPNPFNPETWIPYQLHESGEVVIRIHNVTGELVRELRLGYKSAGIYTNQDRSAYWDGRNEAGERVSSGVYFYNIQAGNYNATMKMIVKK